MSVNVFGTKVLTGDTIFTTPTGIAKGAPSPRTEILLNIDFPEKRPGLLLTYDTWYTGAAIRVGDMKLLMHVPNATWYQTPEDGGIAPPMEDIWVTV